MKCKRSFESRAITPSPYHPSLTPYPLLSPPPRNKPTKSPVRDHGDAIGFHSRAKFDSIS